MNEALDDLVDTILEREAYRSVLSAALTLLYDRHIEIQRLEWVAARLREENRSMRVAVMT